MPARGPSTSAPSWPASAPSGSSPTSRACPSAGWGALGAGLGLLAIAILRAIRRQGVGWQAWVGGALAAWGGWGVLGATIPGFPTLGDLVVPLVLVLIGVAVLRRGMRPGPGAGR